MKKIYLIAAFVLSVFTLSAQNLRTGYFLDGYSYRYQFNPAFQGERGFIALPVINGISFGAESTLAVKDFLYPTSSGKLGTFLHPEVSDAEVMKNLGQRTMLNTNLDMNLLAFGFRAKKTYHTLDVSLKGNVNATLPGDIFRFMKVGASDGNAVYDLANLSLSSDVYAQVAYGFSRRFLDMFNVGIRLKALMGVASARTNVRNLSVSMNSDQWMVSADGSASFSSIYQTLMSGEEDILNEAMAKLKSPDLGFAVDLGVSVDLFKYLTLSASIVDLGAIGWKNSSIYTLANDPWVYNGFDISASGEGTDNIEDQLNAKLDELAGLFNFEGLTPQQVKKNRQKLAMTMHVGLEARLPFYERLSAGLLATHRFNGSHSWTEGRFSVNWALLRWFSLAANYAISDFGHSFGGALNLHPKGFSVFLGTDSFRPFTSFSPNMIPLNDLNTNLVFGVNFPFGKYNGRFPKPENTKESKKSKKKAGKE
jgi:hypothetical protein